MKKQVFSLVLVAVAMLASVKVSAQTITTFPWEQNFTDSAAMFSTWTMIDQDTDSYTFEWYGEDGHNADGCLDAYWITNDYAVSPAITVPADASNFALSFWTSGYYNYMYAQYGYTIYGSYEVLVSTTTTDSAAFTDSIYGEFQVNHDWAFQTVSLSQYAGQTIYIAFHTTNYCYGGFSVDDLTVGFANNPVYSISGPTTTQTGVANDLGATYLSGDMAGMTTTWTSTMATAGNATIADASALNTTITYTAAGTDQIVFTATNSHGTFSDTLTVDVVTCDAISSFPWNESFEGSTACWTLFTNDNGSRGFSFYGNEEYANTGSFCLFGSYSDDMDVDQWAVSPAIALPAGSNMTLTWNVAMSDWEGVLTHYQVLVSTTGTDVADFTQIHDETDSTGFAYVERSASLADYAGQTVRIAFRNLTGQGGDAMLFDDISIVDRTGIESVNNGLVSINPNPATDIVSINAEGVEGNVTVSIVDLNGRTMMQQSGSANGMRFDVSTLAAGTYFVQMVGENVSSTSKLVVK